MKRVEAIFLLCFCLLNLAQGIPLNTGDKSLNRVCYYTYSNPAPSQLNVTLCTHIIAGFSGVRNDVIYIGGEERNTFYKDTNALKKQNPELKVLLSIGGGGNDQGFSQAVKSVSSRKKFLKSIFYTLNLYGFDGLDIDWEFPVWNDYVLADKQNFIFFLQEFQMFSVAYASRTGNPMPLITVAVAAPKTIVDKAYNIPEMAKYVDFINLMTYDFHDYFWYTPFTAHNSPLFNRSVEKAYFSTLNTAWSANYWFNQGMPKSKIMVGIPTYAHTYKLLDPQRHGIDAPATGVGAGAGSITFTEVCKFLSSGGQRVFDEESKVPYAYKDYDWISYEDQESIVQKALWIKTQGFGGAMTFDLNTDDFSYACDNVTFPLHRIIYEVFNYV